MLGCREQPRALYRLQEESATRLPAGVVPSGATLGDDGAFVVWSRESSLVVVHRNGARATLCPGLSVHPVGAAFVAGDSTVEIMAATGDSSALDALVARGTSPCSVAYRVPDEGRVLSAARCGSGWVLGVQLPAGRGRLVGLDSAGRRRWTLSDSSTGSPLNASRSLMAAGRAGIVVSSLAHPFRSAHIDCAGRVQVLLEAEADATPARQAWVGLRALQLEEGYLQVLADPRSDRRRLVAFDRRGRVVRGVDLDVAFGLMASSPDGKFVLAYRRTDVDEVVRYRVLGVAPTRRRT
jgi:hypothetical protein